MKCLYCGNLSSKTDYRGNCISCGAPLNSQILDDITTDYTFPNYIKTIEEKESTEYFNENLFKNSDKAESYFKEHVIEPLKNYLEFTKDFTVDQIYNEQE